MPGLSHERENSTVHRPNRYNKKCMSPIILPRGLRCVFYIYLSRAKRSLVSCSTIFSSTPILLLTYPRVLNLRQNKKKENTTLRVSHDLHPRKFLTMVGTYLFKAAILITLLSTTYLLKRIADVLSHSISNLIPPLFLVTFSDLGLVANSSKHQLYL